jgi:hypothetical protein
MCPNRDFGFVEEFVWLLQGIFVSETADSG